MEEWPGEGMVRWRNGQVEEWPDVIMARWRNGQVDDQESTLTITGVKVA